MAVYTKVSLRSARVLLSDYGIGEVEECEEIAEGVENSNFIIKTAGDWYILTLYEKRVRLADIPYFLNLLQALSEKGIMCPQPIADRQGGILQNISGRAVALFSFLQGKSVKSPRVEHCAQVGDYLARIHHAASDFKEVRANDLSYSGWQGLLDVSAAHADRVRPGLAQKLNMELDFIRKNWCDDLPRGTCHADLFPDNVFFDKDELCGVIDFYFACTDFLIYDLAITLNAWCWSKSGFDKLKGEALMRSYDSVRPLSSAERASFPVLARGAALRFLLTRLFDWVHHDDKALVIPHDPMDFYNILSFHQGIRDVGDYGL